MMSFPRGLRREGGRDEDLRESVCIALPKRRAWYSAIPAFAARIVSTWARLLIPAT